MKNSMVVEKGAAERFGIDVEGIRRALYTDRYFSHARRILEQLAREGYRYGGGEPARELHVRDTTGTATGELVVDLQVFARREPCTILAGVKPALAALGACAGSFDEAGGFVPAIERMRVRAVPDGTRLMPWEPALRIEGRYSDLAILETVLLGFLTRSSSIASNTYRMLEGAGGRPVFFFPARFDLYHTQAFDGLAYKIGVDAYNREHGTDTPALVSTDAQGAFWAGDSRGSVPHAYLVCFFKDTAEAMRQFARCLPPPVKRVALVDVNNDSVGDSKRVALALFEEHRRCLAEGRTDEAERYVLFGVRLDTSGEIRDMSIRATGDKHLDNGVCPRLVREVREALDSLADDPSIAAEDHDSARRYFRKIKIIVSGGFDPDRAALFRDMGIPADAYCVGSWFLRGGRNDFTADVVRVKIGDDWAELAKTGRRVFDNSDLREVRFAI